MKLLAYVNTYIVCFHYIAALCSGSDYVVAIGSEST